MATILVVDDLSANREVLVTRLRSKGHRLLEAENGKQGLAVARAEHPDLVITDVLMPAMDGYEIVRQLRLDPATSRIPVIFYTAHYGEREARALALSSGVAWVLTKPVDPEQVFTIVDRVLAGESETGAPRDGAALPMAFDGDHLRLMTDKLSGQTADLSAANARLRALVNIGLELASERDAERLLRSVCAAARDLFGATYVTLGILDRHERTLQRLITDGSDAAAWMTLGDEITGILHAVVSERQARRGHNVGGKPASLGLPDLHPPVQAFLAAPIASPAHVYGWICLVGNEGRTFTDDDEQLVSALSGQVGRIYENGYFYAMAQRRAAELEREMFERRQAESAVRLERDRARQYLDTADVLLLALDLEGRITLLNRKGCDVLGWTEPELLGRDWRQTCLPARFREPFTTTFNHLIAEGFSIVENPILTKGDQERLIEWRNTVLRDDAGRAIGTFSSGTDVTDRNAAVDALRATEERTRFALDSADVGIWDLDYTTGRLRWSETIERHYGVMPGTFEGTFEAFVERVHAEDRKSLLETMQRAMESGADFSMQNRSIWPDGTVRWLEGSGRILLDGSGRPVRAVGISLDVTERRTLEQQYQQAQKMEAIGRLAGGVAHDFNNLLTVILGFCDLLLDDIDADDPRRADLQEIQTAGVRGAGLTRQLLAFSRKEIIEPALLDLNTIVTDVRAMLARLIGEDVAVVLTLRPALSQVKADRGQLEQIIVNLAVNARDAMPAGGTLTIETADVELDEDYAKIHAGVKPGAYVALTITDTGTGMTPEVQARLFEPFFTTKEPGKGTGLGLATVQGIVARCGGNVGVYSEIGRGTSIKVYLPRANAADIDLVETPIARAHEGAQTVLVIEDGEALREATRRLLERQGYTVLVAANAADALRIFDETPSIDVVLTDVIMPGASGPELTLQLIERRPGLRVIYMSGYTEDAIVHHGVLNRGIAFLHKPFTSDTLGRKIREVLGE
jgi:PAS domain S-box-containing protein